MPVIVQITHEKNARRSQRRDHDNAVSGHMSALDETASHQQQHGAGAIQAGVNRWETSELRRNLHHAAGLVVRRFTRKKHSPNMKIVNRVSMPIEAGSGNTVGLSGYRST